MVVIDSAPLLQWTLDPLSQTHTLGLVGHEQAFPCSVRPALPQWQGIGFGLMGFPCFPTQPALCLAG